MPLWLGVSTCYTWPMEASRGEIEPNRYSAIGFQERSDMV